jgi:hypothetical protein
MVYVAQVLPANGQFQISSGHSLLNGVGVRISEDRVKTIVAGPSTFSGRKVEGRVAKAAPGI